MTIDAIAGHASILIDSCIWVYYLEDHPVYADAIESLLTRCRDHETRLISSELSLLEVKTGPLRHGHARVAAEYQLHLDRYPGLTLAPITRAILNRAARLRARTLLKTPDAIILATALEHGATLAVTNDRGWNKAQGIEIACVADLVEGR